MRLTPVNDADQVRAALTDDHWAILRTIVGNRVAWTAWDRLESRYGADLLEELQWLDLVTRWTLATLEDVVTLTEWGQHVLDVELDERLEVVLGYHVEVPYWVEAGKQSAAVVLPRYPKEVRMPFPELAPAPDPIPVPIDPLTGKPLVTDEESGEPVTLLGRSVTIDPRLKGAPHPPTPPRPMLRLV